MAGQLTDQPGWPVLGIGWAALPDDLDALLSLSLDERDPDRAAAAAIKRRDLERRRDEMPRIAAQLASLPPPPTLAVVDEAPNPRLDPDFEPADWQPGIASPFPEPEDRGRATLSPLGEIEYVEDLIRPGRIVAVAAEEGTGKSYTITGELGIRVAVAGGSFAGTWPVLRTGPVLVLSEMHTDDDFTREATILAALGLDRSALRDLYFRLPLMTAAHDQPALRVSAWREYVVGWCRDRAALLLIFDTATGATQVDPWGEKIQAVYRDLRVMLAAYPDLAIILLIHLKKPTGRGARRLSDVLGEWGRWNDVTLLLEADGTDRTKLSTHKRIRHPRRIVATKREGLLIDPCDVVGAGPKVPLDDVVAAVEATPGMTVDDLAARLGVVKNTARTYSEVAEKAARIVRRRGPRGRFELYPTAQRATSGNTGIARSLNGEERTTAQRAAHPIGGARSVARSLTNPELAGDDDVPPPAPDPEDWQDAARVAAGLDA